MLRRGVGQRRYRLREHMQEFNHFGRVELTTGSLPAHVRRQEKRVRPQRAVRVGTDLKTFTARLTMTVAVAWASDEAGGDLGRRMCALKLRLQLAGRVVDQQFVVT